MFWCLLSRCRPLGRSRSCVTGVILQPPHYYFIVWCFNDSSSQDSTTYETIYGFSCVLHVSSRHPWLYIVAVCFALIQFNVVHLTRTEAFGLVVLRDRSVTVHQITDDQRQVWPPSAGQTTHWYKSAHPGQTVTGSTPRPCDEVSNRTVAHPRRVIGLCSVTYSSATVSFTCDTFISEQC